MSNIIYKDNVLPDIKSLEKLYGDAGWKVYTNNIERLKGAFDNSTYVLTAWDNDKLVGLVRILSDNSTIAFIQDILVLKEYKRLGIGTYLLQAVFEKYKDVGQKTLVTYNSEETIKFYKANGMIDLKDISCIAFTRINSLYQGEKDE